MLAQKEYGRQQGRPCRAGLSAWLSHQILVRGVAWFSFWSGHCHNSLDLYAAAVTSWGGLS